MHLTLLNQSWLPYLDWTYRIIVLPNVPYGHLSYSILPYLPPSYALIDFSLACHAISAINIIANQIQAYPNLRHALISLHHHTIAFLNSSPFKRDFYRKNTLIHIQLILRYTLMISDSNVSRHSWDFLKALCKAWSILIYR